MKKVSGSISVQDLSLIGKVLVDELAEIRLSWFCFSLWSARKSKYSRLQRKFFELHLRGFLLVVVVLLVPMWETMVINADGVYFKILALRGHLEDFYKDFRGHLAHFRESNFRINMLDMQEAIFSLAQYHRVGNKIFKRWFKNVGLGHWCACILQHEETRGGWMTQHRSTCRVKTCEKQQKV